MKLVAHIAFLLIFFWALNMFKLLSSILKAKRGRELVSLEKYYYYFYSLLILVMTLLALNNLYRVGTFLLN